MNRTKIEWCSHTWNVVTGCLHGCLYCYAARIYNRFGRSFEPQRHPERLRTPMKVKKPSRVFVSSTGDLFGKWVPEKWIREVIDISTLAHWHTFIFLTKNPERLKTFNLWPPNAWVGASITDQASADRTIPALRSVESSVRFLSIEPLLGEINLKGAESLNWIIVGAQTGPGAKPPDWAWGQEIIQYTDEHNIPLFMKDNLGGEHFGMVGAVQEYPECQC